MREGGLLQRSRGTAPPLLLLPPLLVPLPRQLGRFVVCGEHALLSARLAPRHHAHLLLLMLLLVQ